MQSRRKGAVRYIVLAVVLQVLSRSLERMGDLAVAAAGPGQGAGSPYYIPALLLTLTAIGLFLLALKRLFDRITGRSGGSATPAYDPVEETVSAPAGFDPDEALRRYMAKRPAETPPAATTPARPGGFGRRGL